MIVGHFVTLATRACEIGGLSENHARASALMAVAELLMQEAENKSIAAQHADTAAYRRRDEEEAERCRAQAFYLSNKADALKN